MTIKNLKLPAIDPCDDYESVRNPLLRDRLRGCWGDAPTEQFIARKDREEAGYLSLDIRKDLGIGVIYEIFVIEKYRRGGIGASLLAHGEKISKDYGFAATRLRPRSFDSNGPTDQELTAWCARKGYVLDPVTNEMEKKL